LARPRTPRVRARARRPGRSSSARTRRRVHRDRARCDMGSVWPPPTPPWRSRRSPPRRAVDNRDQFGSPPRGQIARLLTSSTPATRARRFASSTTSCAACRSASTCSRLTTAPSSSRSSTATPRSSASATSTSVRGRRASTAKVEPSHRVDAQEFYQLLDQREAPRVGGQLQLQPAAWRAEWTDALRTAFGEDEGRSVNEELRRYSAKTSEGG